MVQGGATMGRMKLSVRVATAGELLDQLNDGDLDLADASLSPELLAMLKQDELDVSLLLQQFLDEPPVISLL